MTRSYRLFLAAAVSLCAAPDALAQYPQQPPPAYAPPGQAQAYPPIPAAKPPPRLQVAATAGWQVNGDVNLYSGKLVIDDTQSFGISLQVAARPGTKIELLWLTSRPTAQIDSYTVSYPGSKPFNIDTNYFQIGGVQSVRRGALEPFAGGTLGAVWYAPDKIESTVGLTTSNPGDTWRFAMTVGGGLNVFLTPALAIRAHARMLVPMYFNGGSIYVGSGGSGAAVSAGIPAVSGEFGAGLTFAH